MGVTCCFINEKNTTEGGFPVFSIVYRNRIIKLIRRLNKIIFYSISNLVPVLYYDGKRKLPVLAIELYEYQYGSLTGTSIVLEYQVHSCQVLISYEWYANVSGPNNKNRKLEHFYNAD